MQSVSKLTAALGNPTTQRAIWWSLMGLFGLLTTNPGLAQSIQELDRIIAIVNDDVIVMSELDRRIAQVRKQLTDAGNPAPPYQVLQKQVLERLVMDRLQTQVAAQTGIVITEDQLNTAMSDMAERAGLSLRSFRDAIRQDGYDYPLFREQIREQLLIGQARQIHVSDQIVVSERDVTNFLSMQAKLGDSDFEYRLSHILIATPEGASATDIARSKERGSASIGTSARRW